MLRALLTALALLLLASAGYLRGCAGPRPMVLAVALERTPAGLVPRATVRNDGGAGQVEVRFRLRVRATGRVVGAEVDAELERGEVLEVRGESPLPPGEYEIQADAEYPPR